MPLTESKQQIVDLLKKNPELSIDELVAEIDLAKTTLREHLIQLERDQFVKRSYHRSGPGRPKLVYKLAERGESLYPSMEPQLFADFLSYLEDREEQALIHEFFETFWESREQKARKLLGMDEKEVISSETDLTPLIQMLEEEGFMPELESDPGSISIKECNCPFAKIINVTDQPCRLEAKFYDNLFGSKIDRTAFIPSGDHTCTYQTET